MKTNYFTFCFCLLVLNIEAQFSSPQLISDQTIEPRYTIPADLDGDNDIDIIAVTYENFSLEWYENLDGLGSFGEKSILNNNPVFYIGLKVMDYDADGDNDIVFIENNPRTLKWIENVDGNGNFGGENLILEEDFIWSYHFLDFDNDGDLDLFCSFRDTFDFRFSWYPNLDGEGTWGDEINLLQGINELSNLNVTDIDGDGLLDFIGSHENSGVGTLIWYKNLGNQTLGEESILYEFPYRGSLSDLTSITSIRIVDLDGDNLEDILFDSHNDDIGTFTWWKKKLDATSNYGDTTEREDLRIGSRFFDLDNDGDNDILYKIGHQNYIGWVEFTDPTNTFEIEREIETNVDQITNVNAADLDGDGLLDVISTSLLDNKIVWYKNSGELSIDEMNVNQLKIYPNPASELLNIESGNKNYLLEILTLQGSLIKKNFGKSIVVSNLISGSYILKMTNQELKTAQRVVFIKR